MALFAKFLVFFILLLKILLVSTQDDAGNFTQLIAGGYRPKEHTLVKHIVSIQIMQASNVCFGCGHMCAGSILSSRIILTAAHCVCDLTTGKIFDENIYQIVVKTPKRLKKSQQTEILNVQKIVMHSRFNPKTGKNDVALMKLTSDIGEDGVYAQSISLPDGPAKSGKKCTAIGWGTLFHGGPIAGEALYVDVNILSASICKRGFSNYDEGMLCVGDLSDLEKNACEGDSGGPLICDGKVTGIASFVDYEFEHSVFTDVWYYREWILRGGKEVHRINIFKVLLLPLLVWIVS